MSARGNEQPETSTLPTLINTLPWKARESPALPSVTKLTLIKGACIFQRGETSNTTQKTELKHGTVNSKSSSS